MPHVADIIDRVARALGPDADAARVEAVVSSLVESSGPAAALTGGRLYVTLEDCSSLLTKTVRSRSYDKIRRIASHMESALTETGLRGDLHIATSPLTRIAGRSTASDLVLLARMLDDAARDCSASEIRGLTACAEHGTGAADEALLSAIPEALHATSRVVVGIRAASPEAGVNVDAVVKVVEALRRYNGAQDDLMRLQLSGDARERPHTGDAALYVTADISNLIDEALRAAPDAPLQEVAGILTATAFGLGRTAALQGDAAAALLRSRSGLDVRFGGIDVNPGFESTMDGVLNAAFAAAAADGFRAATPGAYARPPRGAAAFTRATTDGAAGARLAARLAYRPRAAISAVFTDHHAGELLRIGPFDEVRVYEPVEPEWIRRGGQIPAMLP